MELNWCREIPCSQIIVKWAILSNGQLLPTLIYRFWPIPLKLPVSYFVNINKLILNYILRSKRTSQLNRQYRPNTTPKLEDALSYFKIYYKVRIIKSMCYWNNRQLDQWTELHKQTQMNTAHDLQQRVQFSHSVMSDSLRPHESQHARPPCPSPTPGIYPNHVHWIGDAIQPSHPL